MVTISNRCGNCRESRHHRRLNASPKGGILALHLSKHLHFRTSPTRAATVPATQSTSSSLIQRVRAHDADAWERLVVIYGPLVYRWSRQAGLQENDAADIAQEVFRAVALNIENFRHSDQSHTFRGWLWTIARNKIRDHGRQQGNQAGAIGGTDFQRRLDEVPATPEAVELSTPDNDDAVVLHRALDLIRDEFEEHTWQAFWRTTVDRQSSTDIAVELNMTPGAVRQAKFRVLQRLRRELAELFE